MNIIYIGETLNFKRRKQQHINGLRIPEKHPLIGRFITPEMKYGKDYEFKILATPPENIGNIYEKKVWLSCVESYMINKYKTYKLGNNQTGSWI